MSEASEASDAAHAAGFIMTGQDRAAKYKDAILANFHGPDGRHSTWWLHTDEMSAAIMAIADAEMAEKDKTITNLQDTIEGMVMRCRDAEAERDELRKRLVRSEMLANEWSESQSHLTAAIGRDLRRMLYAPTDNPTKQPE